jgi:1-acyl-sn-glycerol-3-phosphate acyltransferase
MKTILAAIRFFGFGLWILLQFPTLIFIAPFSGRFGNRQFRFFTRGCAVLLGIKIRATGTPSSQRPLLIIGNHISIFDMVAIPVLFGNSFFAKAEMRRWPIVGWFTHAFGNMFIDRRPSHAADAVAGLRRGLARAKYPFGIFPEGTTDNGAHILPFKSAMFEFLKDVPMAIQPVVIFYRDKNGAKIPPQILADEYAYIDNAKQLQPPYAARDLSVFQLFYKCIRRGGYTAEVHIMPTYDPTGKDRKQIAAELHDIVETEFCKFI